jgi:hypothetical protein
MKSKISAVIAFNKREAIRFKTLQYMLGILMLTFIWEAGVAISQPNIITIDVAMAQAVSPVVSEHISEAQVSVGEVKVASSVPDIIRKVAQEKGFKQVDNLLRLAKCESSFNEKAVHKNGDGTTDFGTMQWNNYYHPEISKECALNAECAVSEAIDWINKGHLKEWHCDKVWDNEEYKI